MYKSSIVFLQAVLVLFAAAVLIFMLWEPHFEGRNAQATAFEIYFKDPFLAFAYLASTPFFIGLYQAHKLLRHVARNTVFTPPAVKAVTSIKYCAWAMIAFVCISVLFLFFEGDPEDRPPGIMLRILLTFASTIVASAAALLEKVLQRAVDLQAEHELTV